MFRLFRCLIATCVALALVAPAAQAAVIRGWTPAGDLGAARHLHGSVRLDSGQVLVAGGFLEPSQPTRSAELFDPSTRTWSPAGSMQVPRGSVSLVKLRNGKVLAVGGIVSGGSSGTPTETAEVYDPATNAWSFAGSMATRRVYPTVNLLSDGRVLVAGGQTDSTGTATNAAEFYSPDSNGFSPAGTFATARQFHSAAPLSGGRVLIAGGFNNNDSFLKSTSIYDGSSLWPSSGPMTAARWAFALNALPDGRVLATGGMIDTGTLASAELYDPSSGIWTAATPMSEARDRHTATTLTNGRVLAVAGYANGTLRATAELYDPVTNAWTPTGSLRSPRFHAAETLLADGRVLISGGFAGVSTASTEIYTPTTSLHTDAAAALPDTAVGASATAVVQITNTGDSPLLTDDFAVGGANPTDFTVDGSRCRGPIAPNATCLLEVRFTPAAVGARSATLTFSANTATTPAIALSGRGFTPSVDTDGDGVTANDRCPTLKGPAARQGCPTGLLADPSIRYRPSGKGIRVIAYYVKATTGARVSVACSKKACKATTTKGKGAKRVRITRLNNRRLANGAKIKITVSKPGRLTTTVTDRISRGRRIEGRPRCTPVGC